MATLVEMDLESHDRLIAYVLGLSHALNIAFFTALAESGEAAPKLATLSSTTFDAQLGVAGRVAAENPDLYFEIQTLNDYGTESLAALLYAIERLRSVVRANDIVIAMTLIFVLYSFVGGLIAAAWTDLFQGILIIVLSFMLIPLAWSSIGGFDGLHASLEPFRFSLATPSGVGPWAIAMLTVNGLVGIMAQPHQLAAVGTGRDERTCRQIAPEAGPQPRDVDVEHHHHEEKQHHHRPDVDQHQRDGKKLGLQLHPDCGRGAERQHQVKGGMHGVARRDDAQRREEQDRGETIEDESAEGHRYAASSARSFAILPS